MREREIEEGEEEEEGWGAGTVCCTSSIGRRGGEGGERGMEQRREAVIKSDCIASRMSQESRISGDVKPCLTPQLDNCGCGS